MPHLKILNIHSTDTELMLDRAVLHDMKLYSLLCVALLLGIVKGEGETSQCTVSVFNMTDSDDKSDIIYTITCS